MQYLHKGRLPLMLGIVALTTGACGSGSDTTSAGVDVTDPFLFVNEGGVSENIQQLNTDVDTDFVDANFNGASQLSGAWVQCGGRLQNKYVFSGGNYELHFAIYQDDNCQGNMTSSSPPLGVPFASGTYELSGYTRTNSGIVARNIDFTTTYVYQLTESFNDSILILEEGGLIDPSEIEDELEDYPISYDIVYLGTFGELVFGHGSGSFPETRPTGLAFELPFFRQE